MNSNEKDVAPQNTLVKITPNEKGNPLGRLAGAEIHFVDGVLAGRKLTGFDRSGGGGPAPVARSRSPPGSIP